MDANAAIDWRQLLEAELVKLGNNKQALATRIGVSRPYVSRVMNQEGKSGLPHPPKEFIQRVIDCLHVVICPVSNKETPRDDCAKANGHAPTHNPLAVQLWRKCQTCPHKPEGEAK